MGHENLDINYDNAYPSPYHIDEAGKRQEGSTGLTKREVFAAMALQAFITKPDPIDSPQMTFSELVDSAVSIADQLIERLKRVR